MVWTWFSLGNLQIMRHLIWQVWWYLCFAFNPSARTQQLEVLCLAQRSHLSCGIEGGSHQSFTPPTFNPCWTQDSNPQPLGYKPNSLTTKPWLPLYQSTRGSLLDTAFPISPFVLKFGCSLLLSHSPRISQALPHVSQVDESTSVNSS